MRGLLHLAILTSTALFLACEGSTGPGQDAALRDLGPGVMAAGGIELSATGGGHYLLAGFLDIKLSVSAVQDGNGNASGQFRQSLIFGGNLIDFKGRVTCLAVDSENGRAWIGGVVTQNLSEHPDFQTDLHEPGDDVWFRVLDSGEGSGADPDRTTFLGFEGAGGIITSEEYCEAQIWPDDNARTNPVTQGNIQVRP